MPLDTHIKGPNIMTLEDKGLSIFKELPKIKYRIFLVPSDSS